MLAIKLTFPGRRFHGTTWGSHVNEADVEWPPSPWRLCRALIATGYRKLGWDPAAAPPRDAVALLDALAQSPPALHVPAVAFGQTRHYMPLQQSKTARVLDTFAHVGERPLYFRWPQQQLADGVRGVLDELLEHMTWLGRAESWVVASRVVLDDDLPRSGWSQPLGPHAAHQGDDAIARIAPMSPARYDQWRQAWIKETESAQLQDKQRVARGKGKKPPSKLSPADGRKIAGRVPSDVVTALQQDTATLRKAGWSQPPGSRIVRYPVPPQQTPRAASPLRRAHMNQGPRVVVLTLVSQHQRGQRLPQAKDVCWRADDVHQRLVRGACSLSDDKRAPSILTGQRDGAPLQGHRHVYVLPTTSEGLLLGAHSHDSHGNRGGRAPDRRHLDHIVLYCREGFGPLALAAIQRIHRTWDRSTTLWLTPVAQSPWDSVGAAAVGSPSAEVDATLAQRLPILATASQWSSVTPFVPPRYLKRAGKNSLLGQVQSQCEAHGQPAPSRVEVQLAASPSGPDCWVSAEQFATLWPALRRRDQAPSEHRLAAHWRHFRIDRKHNDRRPPQRCAVGIRLTFARPIQGPVTLGWGAHFGLGSFAPAAPARQALNGQSP